MDVVEFQTVFGAPVRNGIYKAKEFQGRGVRLVKMNQLFSERSLHSQADGYELIELTEKERQTLLLKKNDLLFSRTSVVADGVGKCSIIAEVNEELTWDSNIIRVRLNPDKAYPQFYFYFFNSPAGRDVVKRLSSGAAVTTITGSGLAASHVPLPPLPTQRRIASVLSAYDELIENNQRRIRILEEMARSLYREWFVHFRYPGHESVPLTDSPLGAIPQGWEIKKLGDLISYNRRAAKPGHHLDERRYVPIDCLPSKSLALLEAKPIEEAQSSLQLFEKGDILFGAMRPYFHKVVVAPFAGVTRTTCFVFKPARPEWHAFATMTAFEEATVAYANAHSQGATIPYAVWGGSLSEMPLVLPPDALLRRFEKVVAPMLARLSQSFFTLSNLRRTRDLLLPRLLSGQVNLVET